MGLAASSIYKTGVLSHQLSLSVNILIKTNSMLVFVVLGITCRTKVVKCNKQINPRDKRCVGTNTKPYIIVCDLFNIFKVSASEYVTEKIFILTQSIMFYNF